MKLFWPADGDAFARALGGIEVAIALLLWRRTAQAWIARGVMLFALVGAVQAFTERVPCGCLGRVVRLEWQAHLVLCGLTGLLASWLAFPDLRRSDGA